MATTVTVDSQKVIAALTGQSLAKRKTRTLNVGYSAPYAVYVHENLKTVHPRGGQAKFLQEPARVYAPQIGRIVQEKLRNKRSLDDALTAGGKYLLEKSMPLVPVDTGFLRASNYLELV